MKDRASPPKRRRLQFAVLLLALLTLAGLAIVPWVMRRSQDHLAQAVADADRLDPNWRFADLEARLPAVGQEPNPAAVIAAVWKIVPTYWPAPPDSPETLEAWNTLGFEYATQAEHVPPSRAYVAGLKQALEKVEPALPLARQLGERPPGRIPVEWTPDFYRTDVPEMMLVQRVPQILRHDVVLQADRGDMPGALRSVKAGLHLSRSLAYPPTFYVQAHRLGARRNAQTSLIRALGQGEASAADLAPLQAVLEDEAAQPSLLQALRFERAGFHRFTEALASGAAKSDDVALFAKRDFDRLPTAADRSALLALRLPERQHREFAALMRAYNGAVESAKLPPWEQTAQSRRLAAGADPALFLSRNLLTRMVELTFVSLHSLAETRCCLACVAVERFRLATGKWPATLAEICPQFLPAVPLDPFDGRPLRYRRFPDYVAVYSIGADGFDDGGNMPALVYEDSTNIDVGFRLWNPAERGQPPAEKLPPPRAAERP